MDCRRRTLSLLPARLKAGRNRSEFSRLRFGEACRDKEILLAAIQCKPKGVAILNSGARACPVSNGNHIRASVPRTDNGNIRTPMSASTTRRTSTSTTTTSSSTRTSLTMRTATMVLHQGSFRSLSLREKVFLRTPFPVSECCLNESTRQAFFRFRLSRLEARYTF